MAKKYLINPKKLQDLLIKLEEFRTDNKLTSGEFEFLLSAELKIVESFNSKILSNQIDLAEEEDSKAGIIGKFIS